MKNMKIPKCPKTVSGKHKWIEGCKELWIEDDVHLFKLQPYCAYCGMTDDRKKVKNEQKDEKYKKGVNKL